MCCWLLFDKVCPKTKMLHKSINSFRAKLLTSVKVYKYKNPYILGSRASGLYFSPLTKESDGAMKIQHPTHHLTCRGFRSGTELRNSAKQSRFGVNFTLRYSLKFVFTSLFRDRGIVYHVGHSFLDGIAAAFHFVTSSLYTKNYDSLEAVVTPELLQKIKDEQVCFKNVDDSIFRAEHLVFISFINMFWRIDRATKVKTLEVLVRFAYFDKYMEPPKTFQGWMSVIQTGKLNGSTINFAVFRFFRTYGDEMKDSQWMISDLSYFSGVLDTFFNSSK